MGRFMELMAIKCIGLVLSLAINNIFIYLFIPSLPFLCLYGMSFLPTLSPPMFFLIITIVTITPATTTTTIIIIIIIIIIITQQLVSLLIRHLR